MYHLFVYLPFVFVVLTLKRTFPCLKSSLMFLVSSVSCVRTMCGAIVHMNKRLDRSNIDDRGWVCKESIVHVN